MYKFIKITFVPILTLFILSAVSSCGGTDATGPAVLNVEIEGECGDIIVMVWQKGEYTNYLYPGLEDGKFRVEYPVVEGFVDFAVAIGEEVYGAHVNAGDSLHMVCSPVGDGKYEIEYTGSTERESRIWTDFYDVYGYWGQYNLSPDPDPGITSEQSLSLLASRDAFFREKYGPDLNAYQAHFADLMCLFFKAAFMEKDAYEAGVNVCSLTEYREMMQGLDPDDPYVISSGLINRWASCVRYGLAGEDELAGVYAFVDGPGKKIHSARSRAVIAEMFAGIVTEAEDADRESVLDVLDRILSFAPEAAEAVEKYLERYEEKSSVFMGMEVPDIILRTAEGTDVKLSSLYGKVLYIDVWATWCGPCVKETPYLAELVSRFKGDDRIAFLSFSSDDDSDEGKWLAKISADAPEWPQYRIPESQYGKFASALGIHSIPRFVVVDASGRLYDADAPRPSSEGIDNYIQNLLSLL